MQQIPEWLGYASSGAIFIFIFGLMAKWIMNGLREDLKGLKTEVHSLGQQFHGLDKELAKHEHLPNSIEKLQDRVRDTEKEVGAAWSFIHQKFPNETYSRKET